MSMTMQQETALDKANEVRLARAAIRRELRKPGGTKTLADLIEQGEPAIQTKELSALLGMCWRIGHERSASILRHINASRLRTVGDLTDRQQELLLAHLRHG